jgi:glutamate synthase (NADPH/NADH) large chain/glutamate synthase (ferredoxin)
LYDPRFEKDGCGIGLVADLSGRRSHAILAKALTALAHMSHRGAQGCDPLTGDGAGILLQLPDALLRKAARGDGVAPGAPRPAGFDLPAPGSYAVGMIFLPRAEAERRPIRALLERHASERGFRPLGWRPVPVASSALGPLACSTEPGVEQLFLSCEGKPSDEAERGLYVLRRLIEKDVRASNLPGREHFYVPSLSTTTIVYKGLMLPERLAGYYTDLADPLAESALALVHSRFSTNTFPAWRLAHPYRYLCHNGEINTLRGNINWMKSREGGLRSELFGDDLRKIFPVIEENQSDSACLDNALEFLVAGGRSLPHAMMMLIPEPWVGNPAMTLERRGFYEYHAAMMEPWDGPAAVCFTDGRVVGATLDRNGLRPCRYQRTKDGLVTLASEAGVLVEDPVDIVAKGRLEPGKMFLIDLAKGRIVEDEEIKSEMASRKPYRSWVLQHRISVEELPEPLQGPQPDHLTLRQRQKAFGYSIEELNFIMTPMAVNGEEPTSSMGADTPPAILSDRPQLLFRYFRQLFAQVSNPPIDPIREQLVMSLVLNLGPKFNLLEEKPESCRHVRIKQPILTNSELQKIRDIAEPGFHARTLSLLFSSKEGPEALERAVEKLCWQAVEAIKEGEKFLILSDRGVRRDLAAIPSLLAVSAVHHHLVERSLRAEVGIIVESGEPRDVHHFACLLGYGAGAINPYLAFETLVDMVRTEFLPEGIDGPTAQTKYVAAISKGLLKIFSKMGISTVQSYCGGEIFEALGLSQELTRRWFSGTVSRIGGIGIRELGEETLRRHAEAFSPVPSVRVLGSGGDIHYRVRGEAHVWTPETISTLQRAAREGKAGDYAEFSKLANEEAQSALTLRGLLEIDFPDSGVPLAEVEPVTELVKRFTTGAMSLGAISREAHETLAVAMNRIGAKSNTGEGGEDPERFVLSPNGDSRSSAIKQIASARFGVTTHYAVNARELQIKIAQGAKPGEGGQLPGHKVDDYIARLRHSTPGVQLISPPPHHDIYSIEDLKQLIYDLKSVNPSAEVSVKLVSEVGVGTVAAGCTKAGAAKVLISGDSGGTGASPLSSIKYAGLPWELGLAETHQTLVLNGLRDRVRIETDGGMKTGRDVLVAALLGAEEFGFSTAPLIALGCIMMRKCHLNTCPVGVATQDPELRKMFAGKPEDVIRYLFAVAEETRELLAKLGFRTLKEAVGRADLLRAKKVEKHWKARGLDLTPLLARPTRAVAQIPDAPELHLGTEYLLDGVLLDRCARALEKRETVAVDLPIRNTDRAAGTRLSGEIARRHGPEGLADGAITVRLKGSAGQSFGAFLVPGVALHLEGESNDYLGKGLSGGRIVVTPPAHAGFDADGSILIGNTSLYGATSGDAFIRGMAGERFAVRNSGARAVVEGTGDHGCEYMTGGRVVVLGKTGRNFAAGMSGGIAYVYDEHGAFGRTCNQSMVELQKVVSPEDRRELRGLIREHIRHTSSKRARKIIGAWRAELPKFIKVMPIEYKRALEEKRAAAAAKPAKKAARG